MSAGLSPQAKRGKTKRWLYKVEQECRELFPDAAVERHGERYVTVHKPKDLEQHHYAQALSISLSWGNMSNGESIGTILLNGKWPGWGNWTEQLRDAYAKL